ncbi:MAG: response regulator [Candidatus Rokubacteria bacterium]|nr:response regulator [Candidatus Rokubacteria bacterium]
MDRHRSITILLVEDNPDHAELTLRALQSGNLANEVFWVKDGEEALDFLNQRGRYGDGVRAPRPGLILLDIKLPKVDGTEVLRQIKRDERLRTIPVVMLTTSAREDEVNESYRAGANSFVTKPVRFAEFAEKVATVKLYWMLTNLLPEG